MLWSAAGNGATSADRAMVMFATEYSRRKVASAMNKSSILARVLLKGSTVIICVKTVGATSAFAAHGTGLEKFCVGSGEHAQEFLRPWRRWCRTSINGSVFRVKGSLRMSSLLLAM